MIAIAMVVALVGVQDRAAYPALRQISRTDLIAIRGIVQDTSCSAIPGARVSTIDAEGVVHAAITGPDGRFEIGVPPQPDKVQVHAEIAGFLHFGRTGVPARASSREQVFTLDAASPAHADPVLMPNGAIQKSPQDAQLRGQVLTSDCQPVANAEVTVGTQDGTQLTVTTDLHGRFRFDPLPPGTYPVTAHASGLIPLFRHHTPIGATNTAPIALVLDSAANGSSDGLIDHPALHARH